MNESETMQLTTTNGTPNAANAILDSLRQFIAQLQADNLKQQEEIKKLKGERDEFRSIVYDHLKKRFDPKDWDDFNPAEFTLTLDDLLADFKEK